MAEVRHKIGAALVGLCSLRLFVFWLVISGVIAVAGPFGTFENEPLTWRLAYWAFIIGVSLPIGVVSRVFWHEMINADPLWLEDLLVSATMALTFGPLLLGFNLFMTGFVDHLFADWYLTLGATFFICTAVIAGVNLIRSQIERTVEDIESQKRDRLLNRLDVDETVRLVKVSSDNHHVRILTDDGREHRILMRLRDAVAEIDVEQGFCIHRSHWVAVDQIEEVGSVDGKETVKLRTGGIVPIGPKYRHHLIDAGAIAA